MGIFAFVGSVLIVISLLMLAACVGSFRRSHREKQTWHRVQGVVIEPTWSPRHWLRPRIDFTTRGGRVIQWVQPFWTGWNFTAKGASVWMLYDPEDPRRARFERPGTFGFDTLGCFFLQNTVLCLFVGLGFSVIGGLGMCVERTLNRPHPPERTQLAQARPPAGATTATPRETQPAGRAEVLAKRPIEREDRDPGEGWVVGDKGFLLHCEGYECKKVDAGVTNDLYAISGSTPAAAWAVGTEGTVLHLDGKSWTKESSGVSTTLRSVWARTPNDVWAVGDGGTVLHSDGKAWSKSLLPPRHQATTILAVHGSAPDDVWVTTASNAVLQWDGSSWTERGTFPSSTPLRAIAVFSSKYALLGKGNGILRWDGAKWSADNGADRFVVVALAVNGSEAWGATSDGVRKRARSGGWEPITMSVRKDGEQVEALTVNSPTNAWAITSKGAVLRYSAGAWVRIDSGTSDKLTGVWTPGAR